MPINSKYLVRFDDICPAMNWAIWNRVEAILRSEGISPLLGVVPDNQDSTLNVDPPNPDFWNRVRQWQSWGWTIGLHGYQHLYTTDSAGIVGIKHASEFACVSLREQCFRLRSGAGILRREGVEPRIWIAPGHSFDSTTVTLLREIGISCISDGLFMTPRRDETGMLWIPQQIWRFRYIPFGVGTVCLHTNLWSDSNVSGFATSVRRFRTSITTLDEVVNTYASARRAPLDGIVPAILRYLIHTRACVDSL